MDAEDSKPHVSVGTKSNSMTQVPLWVYTAGVFSGFALLYWLGVNKGIYTRGVGFSDRPVDYVYFAMAAPVVVGSTSLVGIGAANALGLRQ